jgi:predicted transcriptional regulator
MPVESSLGLCRPQGRQVSLWLPNALQDKIATRARLTGRTKSHVAMEALSDCRDWRMPHVKELKQAGTAAEAGEFANEAAVVQDFARLTCSARPNGRRRPARPDSAADQRVQHPNALADHRPVGLERPAGPRAFAAEERGVRPAPDGRRALQHQRGRGVASYSSLA